MSNNIQFRRGSKQDYVAIQASGTDPHDIYLVGGSNHPDIVMKEIGEDGKPIEELVENPLTMYVGAEAVKTEATNTILQEDLIVTNPVGAGSLKTYEKGTNIETILKEMLSVEAWPRNKNVASRYYTFSDFSSSISKPTSTTPNWNNTVVIYGSGVSFQQVNSVLPTATAPTLTYSGFDYGYYDADNNEYHKDADSKPSRITSNNVTLSKTATIQLSASFSGFKDIKVNDNGDPVDVNNIVLEPGSLPVLEDKKAMSSLDQTISGSTSGPSLPLTNLVVGLGSNSVSFNSMVKINAKSDLESEDPAEKQTTLHTASITCDDTYYVLSNYGRYIDVTNENAIYCTVEPGNRVFQNLKAGDFNSDTLTYTVTGVYPIYTNSSNTTNYINKTVDWLANNKASQVASNNTTYSHQNAFVDDRKDFIFLFGVEEGQERMKIYIPTSKSVDKIEIFNDNFKNWIDVKEKFGSSGTTDIKISDNVEVNYTIWAPLDTLNTQAAKSFVKVTLVSKTSVNS